jgi:hypothetical protein
MARGKDNMKKLFKTIVVKKLYRGHASLRDYVVQGAINNGLGIIISYQGRKMTVPVGDLAAQFQFHKYSFSSQYKAGQKYQLIDFFFAPDDLTKDIKNVA